MSQALAVAGHAIVRNPMMVGSTTGFLIILFYVSANAMWYQPHRHTGAFLPTRAAPARIVSEEPDEPAMPPRAAPAPEPRPEALAPQGVSTEAVASVSRPQPEAPDTMAEGPVGAVQRQLKVLGLYHGDVDGLVGPQTRKAVEDYQQLVGLNVTGAIDEALIAQLSGSAPTTSLGDPVPTPAPRVAALETAARDQTVSPVPDRTVVKIQAGLRAFGNDGIEIDGVVGARTADAIREFQSLFGLPVTGKVDGELLSKMDEIGLIDG